MISWFKGGCWKLNQDMVIWFVGQQVLLTQCMDQQVLLTRQGGSTYVVDILRHIWKSKQIVTVLESSIRVLFRVCVMLGKCALFRFCFY